MDPAQPPERVTITVLATQLQALRERLGPELSDEDLYSAAAIAVLLYAGTDQNGLIGLRRDAR